MALLLLGACSSGQKTKEARLRVEVRLADTAPREGFEAMDFVETGGTIYVSPEIALSDPDIKGALATVDDRGRPAVAAELNLLGTQKFAIFTSNHIRERAAIIVDGKVVSAPVIRSPIMKGRLVINGDFTQDEAEALARSLGGSPD